MNKIKILVVGCGNMGASHAKAYQDIEAFGICGVVSRGDSKKKLNDDLGNAYDLYDDYAQALKETSPDAVCISTYPDTHEAFSIMSFLKIQN